MLLPDESHRVAFPRIDGLFAYVQVEGEALEVYGVEEKAGKAVGYVEAVEGKEFEVVLVDLRRVDEITHDWAAYYNVDGISLVTPKSDSLYSSPPTSPDRLDSFWGRRSSPTSLTPLRFGRLQLTDDIDEACQDQEVLEGLGTMRLEYCRVQVMAENENPVHLDQPLAVKPIHEEAKKATFISHQAEYGTEKTVEYIPSWSVEYIDPFESPFSAVEIRYRSARLLRIQGLLPDSPSPPPKASPSPKPSLDASAVRASPSPSRRLGSSSSPIDLTRSTSPKPDLEDLKAELASLRRQERIAKLESEARKRKRANDGGSSSSSSPKKLKLESIVIDVEAEGESQGRRLKREEVAEVERRKEEEKRSGKKPDVLDLSNE